MQRALEIAIVLLATGSARADDSAKVRVREVDSGAWPTITGTEPHVYEVVSDVPIKARLEYLSPTAPPREDGIPQSPPTAIEIQPHQPTWIFATVRTNSDPADCGFERPRKDVACIWVRIGSAELGGTHQTSVAELPMARRRLTSANGGSDNGACGVTTGGHKEWNLAPNASVLLLRSAEAPAIGSRDWTFTGASCDRFEIARGGKKTEWSAWQGNAHALRLTLEQR